MVLGEISSFLSSLLTTITVYFVTQGSLHQIRNLLRLYRSGRFARNCIRDPGDIFDFVCNSITNLTNYFVRQPSPIRSHCVDGFYYSNYRDMTINTLIAYNPDRPIVSHGSICLPYFMIESGSI